MSLLFLRVLRADFDLLESYRYLPEAPLAIPIHVFGGTDDLARELIGRVVGARPAAALRLLGRCAGIAAVQQLVGIDAEQLGRDVEGRGDDADVRAAPRWQPLVHGWQSRRADDHQHRARCDHQRRRLRHEHSTGHRRAAHTSPVVAG